jgi:hypothetical protein
MNWTIDSSSRQKPQAAHDDEVDALILCPKLWRLFQRRPDELERVDRSPDRHQPPRQLAIYRARISTSPAMVMIIQRADELRNNIAQTMKINSAVPLSANGFGQKI